MDTSKHALREDTVAGPGQRSWRRAERLWEGASVLLGVPKFYKPQDGGTLNPTKLLLALNSGPMNPSKTRAAKVKNLLAGTRRVHWRGGVRLWS